MTRLLVGVASVAVIAASAYFVVQDANDRRLSAEQAAAVAAYNAGRDECLPVLAAFNFHAGEKDRTYPQLAECISAGYISAQDVEDERRRSGL